MVFQFDSSSKSDSQGILDFLERIHRINSIEQLEAIIKKAASYNAKELLIKDKGSLSIKIGQGSIAGFPLSISLVPDKEKVYKIQFC
jgi:hypothetical protein